MKFVSKLLFASLALFILVSSCKKKAVRIITSGTWSVSLYKEDAKDETSDFAGYIFEFLSNNTLRVTVPAGTIVIGTWSYDDSNTKYNFSLSGAGKLDKINGSWIILTKSSDLIELRNDNSSKNELLSFKKR